MRSATGLCSPGTITYAICLILLNDHSEYFANTHRKKIFEKHFDLLRFDNTKKINGTPCYKAPDLKYQ